MESLSLGTWTVAFEMDDTPVLVPDGEAISPRGDRIGIAGASVLGQELHLTHDSLSLSSLAKTVAQDFGACAELIPKAKLIVFRSNGSCAE